MIGILPQEFAFAHDFAFFLHDALAEIIVSGEKAGHFRATFEVKSPSQAEVFQGLTGEDLWVWLEENGYEHVLLDVTNRQVLAALVADMCHFVYEALRCSEKGKLTVAYALLRKPFKENLFYLEWLLADPEDFQRTFHRESPSGLDFRKLTKERRLELIRAAIDSTTNPGWVSPNFIYELRYDKQAAHGLESLWNKATHLITTFHAAFCTEAQNFNFVFSDQQARLEQWRALYLIVPLLLYHALEVVDALAAGILERPRVETDLGYLRRITGFLLWAETHEESERQGMLLTPVRDVLHGLRLACPTCKSRLTFGPANVASFYQSGEVECGICYRTFLLT